MLGNILAVGLMSMGMGLSGVKDEPKMAVNVDMYEVEIDRNYQSNEALKKGLKDYWEDLLPQYNTTKNIKTDTTDGTNTYTAETIFIYDDETEIDIPTDQENRVLLIFTNHELTDLKVDLNNTGTMTSWETNANIKIKWYDEELYNLVVSYQASDPEYAGGNIISSIASGLGLIGALATTFLTGFSNLFYSSGALTPFAIFSFVFLGLAVSFAVIKLVLSLIRSNTGA